MSDLENKENEYHAKQLLSNPVFIKMLDEINRGIGREMDLVKPDDVKAMQSLVLLRQASTKIVSYIVSAAESGKITEFNAKRKTGLFNRA